MPPRGQYIPILDGWRAVAILLVLLFHGLLNSDLSGSPRLDALSRYAGKSGTLGVLIFFCISGYLITQKLRSESRARGTFSARDFYIKRVFRILPPLAVYLLVLVALFAAGVITLRRGDWAAPIFLTNYITWSSSWYTTHFWSLSVEEHFYLFWPACAILAGWRRALGVGVLVIAVVGIWRPWELHHILDPVLRARALQRTDMRLDYIMMGCVVALAIEFYPWTAGMLRRLGGTLGLGLLLLALIVSTRPAWLDLRSFQAAILTLMVCGSSVRNARLPSLLLANPVALYIGRLSYSLYIWQQIILSPSNHALIRSPQALPIKYALVFGVASLSYYLVERPSIALGRDLLQRLHARDRAQALAQQNPSPV